jgi:putative DNA primase/helicase
MTYDADSDRYKTRRELEHSREENMDSADTALAAALKYIALGWPVFPVAGKVPVTEHGFKDASLSEEKVRAWWAQRPDAGVAIATGNGLLVLDVDPRNGGEDGLAMLLGDRKLPETVTVITGGGGRHYYFAAPRVPLRSRSGLAPGVDIKADGGYVVAPPSPHQSGRNYCFEASSGPGEVELARVPDWLIAAVAQSMQPEQAGVVKPAPPLPEVIVEGERRKHLLSLAGSMRRRGAGEAAILAAMRSENGSGRVQPPLDDVELTTLAGDVLKRYQAVKEMKREKEAPKTAHRSKLTDLGNAEKFRDIYGADFRYCYAWGKWVTFDGSRWQVGAEGEAERAAQCIPLQLHEEARAAAESAATAAKEARYEDAEKLKAWSQALSAWATKSEATARIKVKHDVFDFDAYSLNCANGTVDLRTGALRPHLRADCITKIIGTAYDPDAKCPFFDEFMKKVTMGNKDKEDCIIRAIGSGLTGDQRDQMLFFFVGTGANGKSKLLECVGGLLGPYAMSTGSDFLTEKEGSQHPTALATLHGKRFVCTIEVGRGRRMDEPFLKMLTGGDTISARRVYEDFWEFRPTHKIFLAANHKPIISADDYAVLRRLLIFEFPATFFDPTKGETGIPGYEKDDQVAQKLQAEWPGILARLVRGCLEWQRVGLNPPRDVLAAGLDYQEEMDFMGAWRSEKTTKVPSIMTAFSQLYASYTDWALANGAPKLSRIALSTSLTRLGFKKGRTSTGANGFWGIALLQRGSMSDGDGPPPATEPPPPPAAPAAPAEF